MGWLDNLNEDRVYEYRPIEDENPCILVRGTKKQLGDTFKCEVIGEPDEYLKDPQTSYIYVYAGFDPVQVGMVTKVVFEKNGRKGVRIKDRNGKVTARSMSRDNLLKGKGVKITGDKRDAQGNKTGKKTYEVDSALTKGCREASNKETAKEVHSRLTGMKQNIEYQAHLAKEKTKGKKK